MDEIEAEYQARHQVCGISFVTMKDIEPIRYATDDDNAVFTGMYLAAAAYRYAARGNASDLEAARNALGGIYLLTHVSGTPGVLARWAFPLAGSWERIGYDAVKSLESPTNSYGQHIKAGRLYEHEGFAFITKTTRDQLSGVLFGLTAAFTYVPELRSEVSAIISALLNRFRKTNWSLIDHAGRTGTSAHKVDAAQRLVVKALHHACTGKGKPPCSLFLRLMPLTTIHYNRIFTRTFSFSLNAMDAHSLFLLQKFHKEKKGTRRWIKRIHCFMRKDDNPYFDALYLMATGKPMSIDSLTNLERRIQSPYPAFFCWQKDSKDWWGVSDTKQGPQIDAALPYWIIAYQDR